jgi:hypothetical protein
MYISPPFVSQELSGLVMSIQTTRLESVRCFIQEIGMGFAMKEPEITAVITKTFPTNTITVRYDQDPSYLPPRPRRGYFYTVTGAIQVPLYINVTVEQYSGPRLRFDLYVPTHKVIGRGRYVPLFESYPLQQITRGLVLCTRRLSKYLNCQVELNQALAQVLDTKFTEAAGYKYDVSIANDIFKRIRKFDR